MKHRILSFLTCLVFVFAFSSQCFASDNSPSGIDDVFGCNQIAAQLPEDAIVQFINGEYHIYVSDIHDVDILFESQINTQSVDITNVYAPDGGSYRNFGAPPYLNSSWPYSQVYMNAKIVNSVLYYLHDSSLMEEIMEYWLMNYAADRIAAIISSTYGISIDAVMVGFFIDVLYYCGTNMQYSLLKTAKNNSSTGKVCLTRMTENGSRFNVYTPWNSNYCPTEFGINATWYDGVFDVNYDSQNNRVGLED